MQQIQNRRSLRDVAEPVAGDGDDEMGRVVHKGDQKSSARLFHTY